MAPRRDGIGEAELLARLLPAKEQMGDRAVVAYVARIAQGAAGDRDAQVGRIVLEAQLAAAQGEQVEGLGLAPAQDGGASVGARLAKDIDARSLGLVGHGLLAPGAVFAKAVAHRDGEPGLGANRWVEVALLVGPRGDLEVRVRVELVLRALPAVAFAARASRRAVGIGGAQRAEDGPGVELLAIVELLAVGLGDVDGDGALVGLLDLACVCARLVGEELRVGARVLAGGGVAGQDRVGVVGRRGLRRGRRVVLGAGIVLASRAVVLAV